MSTRGDISYQTATSSTNVWTSDVLKDDFHLHWFHVIYTSDATVGNRQIVAALLDQDDNIVYDITAGAVQTASNAYHYNYLPGIFRETSFVNGEIQVPFPIFFVAKGGYRLRVYDSANIAAGDSMALSYSVERL